VLNGTAAADFITPNGGPDLVFAGAGDDIIKATINDGFDAYDGGTGSDTVDYSALTASVTVQLGVGILGNLPGFAQGSQSATDLLNSIENASGGQGNDAITGSGSNNTLDGRSGNDVIAGGRGADTIIGGLGNDTLTGGPGTDTFVFKPHFGNDRITDFDADPTGGQDLLDLSSFGITAQSFASRVTVTDLGSDLLVTIDHDPGQTIRLQNIANASALTTQDFLL